MKGLFFAKVEVDADPGVVVCLTSDFIMSVMYGFGRWVVRSNINR